MHGVYLSIDLVVVVVVVVMAGEGIPLNK